MVTGANRYGKRLKLKSQAVLYFVVRDKIIIFNITIVDSSDNGWRLKKIVYANNLDIDASD